MILAYGQTESKSDSVPLSNDYFIYNRIIIIYNKMAIINIKQLLLITEQ